MSMVPMPSLSYFSKKDFRTMSGTELFSSLSQSMVSEESGRVNFTEFKHFWKHKGKEQMMDALTSEEGRQYVQYFKYFDQDGDGELNGNEFANLWNDLKRYGLVDVDSTSEAMKELDEVGDNKVRFNEYVEYMIRVHKKK